MTHDAPIAPLASGRPGLRELREAALTPRMLGILALIVAAAIVCANLGAWQIDRAFERADAARAAEAAALSDAAPDALTEVLEPGAHVMGAMVGHPYEVTGTFDPAGEVLVPDRLVDGESGYLVVTPLRVDGTDAWLAVVRGWSASAEGLPPAPPEPVTLTGAITAGEAFENLALPAGQVDSISPAYFAGTWGLPIYNAYLVPDAESTAALGGLAVVPAPSLDGGTGVDLRNLAYAVQWYVFGGFALFVWYRLVRDDVLARREDAQAALAAPAAAGGGGTPERPEA
ncbi:SURF1 family protein [Serinibacter arcticus]|uniref:SURF1 family protein n=1 Tax=Serinibacter arcticus TaxID=1655435 RepID=UPI001304DB9C|nr:SURF1 family protein [Serinibacter arcticus]